MSKRIVTYKESVSLVDPHEFYATKKAAEFLGIKKNTLEIWRTNSARDQPRFSKGGTVIYKGEHLISWMEEKISAHEKEHGDKFTASEIYALSRLEKALSKIPNGVTLLVEAGALVFKKGSAKREVAI